MEFNIKIRSRFVKRSMGRRRDNPLDVYTFQCICEKKWNKGVHFRLGDPLYGACPVAVRLNRHENGLGPAGCRRACAGGVVVHPQAHGHDLCFHFPNRGKDIRMKWVGDAVPLKCCNEDFFHVITAIYRARFSTKEG